MRAALEHPAWNLDLRQPRVVARGLRSTARVFRNAARLRRIGFVLLRIPVRRPFPDIADHVVQAVAVRRECGDWGCALETVFAKILARKFALPSIGHMLAARRELIAPGKLSAVQSAARGKFPFSFGRQFLAGPRGVGFSVPISDVNDGMIIEPADRAARPVGTFPVGTEFEIPPLRPVTQIYRVLRRREDKRAGLEHMRKRAGIILCVRSYLREGDVAVALTNCRNCRLVTGVRSIQNTFTVTR